MNGSKVIVDTSPHGSLREWRLTSDDLEGSATAGPWSVTKRILCGGRQEGVHVIEVDNGALKFTVVPTRGCNVWTASAGTLRLGWDSPVKEVVHPQFVNLAERGGLGWLNGFGEWISRCGLESMGAACMDGDQPLTLHGRINYLPASWVEVRYEPAPVPRLVVRAIVDETLMFGPQLRLTAEISTNVGSRALTLDDRVTNLADAPQEMQSLYHINFGPPLLGAGATFIAPVKSVAPRDARAAQGEMVGWDSYSGPQPAGYTEQVYLLELYGDDQGMTEAALKAPDGTKGAAIAFNLNALPFMTLWKQEGPLKAGYVTGLEPATGYPLPRPVERACGRVPTLQGGESHHASITVCALASADEVDAAVARIKRLQRAEPQVAKTPRGIPPV
ncbi:MAG: aldose 1-epimerase family protein [Verrucomicrobia bacterium]|nr:aldose 1-epimerase family protein [Verrucomicrobiota bacterium]